jgi:uncharacterized protein (TIGR00730 family)
MVHGLWATILLGCRLMRSSYQIVYGFWRLSRLPQPLVSIFGGSRMDLRATYALKAEELSKVLIEHDISVITGGGGGIMEAANCGANESVKGRGRSIAINVKGLAEGNTFCAHEYLELNYFFARKWLMTHYSVAFIFFPGGFGTIDEFGEVLTLIQTKKLAPVPIILVGRDYWQPLMDWLTSEALSHGLVTDDDLKLFAITDEIPEIIKIVKKCIKTACPVSEAENKWIEQ